MGGYAGWLRRIGHTRWFAAVGKRLAPPLDRFLYRATNGRILSTGPPVLPTLLLTTKGRRTGKPRTVPVLYVRDRDRLVVAGSNWGQPRDPAWALNLRADPRARVRIGADRFDCRAYPATDEERARLWPELDRIWPAYDTYRRRSGRQIQVFVLEPVSRKT